MIAVQTNDCGLSSNVTDMVRKARPDQVEAEKAAAQGMNEKRISNRFFCKEKFQLENECVMGE